MCRARVHDMAEEAGVSIATVLRTCWQPSCVRESTRLKVLEASNRLNAIPSVSARNPAWGKVGLLGIYSCGLFCVYRPGGVGNTGPEWEKGGDEVDICTFPLCSGEIRRGFQQVCSDPAALFGSSMGDNKARSVVDMAGRVNGLALFPRTSDTSPQQNLSTIRLVAVLTRSSKGFPLLDVTGDSHKVLGEFVSFLINPVIRDWFHAVLERLVLLCKPVRSIGTMLLARDLSGTTIGWDETTALILSLLTQPIGVFLMHQFISGIQDGLMDAALVDRASESRIFRYIVLPQGGPQLPILSIFSPSCLPGTTFRGCMSLRRRNRSARSRLLFASSTGQEATDYGVLQAGAALVITSHTSAFRLSVEVLHAGGVHDPVPSECSRRGDDRHPRLEGANRPVQRGEVRQGPPTKSNKEGTFTCQCPHTPFRRTSSGGRPRLPTR